MNRHELATLVSIAAVTLFAMGTSIVLAGVFFAPTATRDLIGEVGILLAALAWFGWTFATIIYRDRILGWVRRRAALSDQP